ncbi:DUF6364 family protein [Gracilimonas sp.]|uniref:DUF6364 family protein n=1 Tax=Gracilimonas sp. TaxID=1974203 RepID=UPI002872713E|nr:DUF6364 family protein [Gracilimonas sp.]
MKKKLTLRLEDNLIEEAKEYAKSKNTSVSQLVADYFKAIDAQKTDKKAGFSPITSSLIGVLKEGSSKKEDYKTYLEEKYLQ